MSGIRLFEPSIGKEEEDTVIETLRSGYWASGSGEGKVKEFEFELAEYLNCRDVVAVNSGTAALHLALSLLDIKGKEVILPALSFVSTANAVLYNGGIPVFADVREDTLCLDKGKIIINENTSCIIPVHFGGYPCDIVYGFPCIEDSAHRIERNRFNGILSCFSFHPVKNLAMPTGGAIASNVDLYPLISRRWCGITERNGVNYNVKELGWNYYMNEISAAIGLVQLRKLDQMNQRRYDIARRYYKELNHIKMPLNEECSYHFYWIRVKNRDEFRKKMLENGIETGIHYRPIDTFSLYKKANLPVTDMVAKEIVTLPNHPNLSDSDLDKVIKVANS